VIVAERQIQQFFSYIMDRTN